jgi:hypothetical protein
MREKAEAKKGVRAWRRSIESGRLRSLVRVSV